MNEPADFLNKILSRKLIEIAERTEQQPLNVLKQQIAAAPAVRDFIGALQQRITAGYPAIIAEIKRSSPSKGIIRDNFDPSALAAEYEQAGATCLSVLTDQKFFMGSNEHLQQARAACSLPILRKDFIIDRYQVYEARYLGADAILLIVAALSDDLLNDLATLAVELQMAVLVEVHNAAELERALNLNLTKQLIGINNRNLRNFQVDLNVTLELAVRIPPSTLIVTESGISTPNDVIMMRKNGINGFLVGEAFMRTPAPGAALKKLFGILN